MISPKASKSLMARILNRAKGLREVIYSNKRFLVYSADLNPYSEQSITSTLPIKFHINSPEAFAVIESRASEYEIDEPIMEGINRQLEEGEVCVSGWVGKELAYYGWIQFKYRLLTRQSKLHMPQGTAFIYRCFTRTDFRGKHIYPNALSFTCQWLADRGFQRVLIDHLAENLASQAGILRSGMRPFAEYRVVRLFGSRWAVPNKALSRLSSNA